MKLYTRQGDDGKTSLFDGSRVPKDDPRVAAYGDVDELNAILGWVAALQEAESLREAIRTLQDEMFILGAELATPAKSTSDSHIPHVQVDAIIRLEGWIDEAVEQVPPLRQFILPGGSELAARLHLARTCCRRAERQVITLSHQEPLRSELIIYLNRLSDLLFAWARLANHHLGVPDRLWDPAK
jgi:cob(I)alamin adenosyltransferase